VGTKKKIDNIFITYSMLSAFKNCQKKCEYRYFQFLVPTYKTQALFFGSIIHNWLEAWYLKDFKKADAIAYHKHIGSYVYNHVVSVTEAYKKRYADEEFDVVYIEKKIISPIIDPDKNRRLKKCVYGGAIDGIVKSKKDNKYYILEHKTASRIDGNYLNKLYTDLQINLYAWFAAYILKIPIEGIIYNVLGKINYKQKNGESDESFQERLATRYATGDLFHREYIVLSHEYQKLVMEDLCKTVRAMRLAKLHNYFFMNTDNCFKFNSKCVYHDLCASNNNELIRENSYTIENKHSELGEKIIY
jgi:hypothetical protein